MKEFMLSLFCLVLPGLLVAISRNSVQITRANDLPSSVLIVGHAMTSDGNIYEMNGPAAWVRCAIPIHPLVIQRKPLNLIIV